VISRSVKITTPQKGESFNCGMEMAIISKKGQARREKTPSNKNPTAARHHLEGVGCGRRTGSPCQNERKGDRDSGIGVRGWRERSGQGL